MKPASPTILGLTGALFVGAVVTVVGLNAARDRTRVCACLDDCWCRTVLGRHLRWWVPARHHKLPPLPHQGEEKPPAS